MGQDGWIRAKKPQQCGTCPVTIPKGENYWGAPHTKWKRKCKTCAGVPATTGLANPSKAERS